MRVSLSHKSAQNIKWNLCDPMAPGFLSGITACSFAWFPYCLILVEEKNRGGHNLDRNFFFERKKKKSWACFLCSYKSSFWIENVLWWSLPQNLEDKKAKGEKVVALTQFRRSE
ncbi:hypothetical protein CEXT_316741 [Caerostris extrusa]|uniref:Uncharacterized protein n=1 Tax=Caerostris extrusa TaxID=172846 RepID=A0AAV4TIM1_CAEEX|nr:hypothetical protein CEXT_316741 [Caerostris extrusa]